MADLVVSPPATEVHQHDTLQFAAFGRTATGDSIAVSVTWSATGGNVTPQGLFTPSGTGNFWVIARSQAEPAVADSAAVSVTIDPDEPLAIAVTPDTVRVAPGSSIQLVAAVRVADGTTRAGPVSWEATGGSIDATGLFQAGDPTGDFTAIATTPNGLADTATIHVRPAPTLTGLTIGPGDFSIEAGQTRQLSVSASWTDGSTTVPPLDWTSDGGVIDDQLRFVAGAVLGAHRIIASVTGGTLADSVTVTVVPPRAVTLAISPTAVLLVPGATHQFTATGTSSTGDPVGVSTTWTATGGTITAQGSYTAGAIAGLFRVIATDTTGLADTVAITIADPPAALTDLDLAPATVTVAVGATQQFTVSGTWSDGVARTPAVAWTATGGTISSSGSYHAGSTPGGYLVIATHPQTGIADTSAVTIVATQLATLTLTPSGASLAPGDTVRFTASGTLSDGTPTVPPVTYSATGGAVGSTGLYTAGQSAGNYRVIAIHQPTGLADTVPVVITATPNRLLAVTVSPPTVTTGTGAATQFTVTGTWSNGTGPTPTVTWTATGGTISTSGRYVGGTQAGAFRIIAKVTGGTLADTAAVTLVAPVLQGIAIAPATVSVASGATQQFTVTGTWSDGIARIVPVTFSAPGNSITTGGLFTAGTTAGTYRVIATVTGLPLADTSTVTVTAPSTGPTPTVTLATYLGGSDVEQLRDAVFDPAGGWCVAGNTKSPDFPTTAGAAQARFGGFSDAVVVCYNQNGTVRASTLVGGPNYEKAYALAIAPNGDIYIAGRAGAGLPMVSGSAQSGFGGGPSSSLYGVQDGFVCRLNHALTQIVRCTYVGGGDDGAIRDMTVAADGTVYWAGWYGGSGNPINPAWTAGAYRSSPIGLKDGTVGRLTGDLSRMICASYTGGTANEAGEPGVLALADGSIVEARISQSADAAGSPALRGTTDMLVTHLSADCRTLIWATRLGGSASEFAETQTLALLGDGRIVVAFGTLSTDFPKTAGHAQPNNAGNASSNATGANSNYPGDCVVTVLQTSGALQAATYLGSSEGDGCQGVGADASSIVVGGTTYGADFPTAGGAWIKTQAGGPEAFLVRLPFDLSRISYATYLGGNEGRCAAATNGQMIGCGMTDATIKTVSPSQAVRGGGVDGLLVRFTVP